MAIATVGVVGCGLMGAGIAQVCAEVGYPVVVREASDALLEKGRARIESFLLRGVQKGKMTPEQMREVLSRIRGTLSFDRFSECDLVIEAVVERLEAKREVYRELDEACPPQTIFASNTSSLSITEMAAVTRRPQRFVGLHFFNPAPLMKLVEVVRSPLTGADTFEEAAVFARSLGKTPLRAGDRTGFIVNRLLIPYLLDAIRTVEDGTGSISDIDEGMRLGCGHPMGPLRLADFVGLDTTCAIANVMFEEFHERRFAPPPLLKRMVQAGLLGCKSGKGFYDYAQEPPRPTPGLI